MLRAAAWARDQLPAELRDVAMCYDWSGSAGVKPWDQLRLHLWGMLTRPVADRSLREYLDPAAQLLLRGSKETGQCKESSHAVGLARIAEDKSGKELAAFLRVGTGVAPLRVPAR